jgi:hypothetical protein
METACVTVLYNGWLLAQARVSQSTFTSLMNNYDLLWADQPAQQTAVQAACQIGRNAKTESDEMRHAAMMTLVWWLFRSEVYRGTRRNWHAECDLVVTLNECKNGRGLQIDLWAAKTAVIEAVATDGKMPEALKVVDHQDYDIVRQSANQSSRELAWFALGADTLGAIVRDDTDHDYGYVVLRPGIDNKYRCVDVSCSMPTPEALHPTSLS